MCMILWILVTVALLVYWPVAMDDPVGKGPDLMSIPVVKLTIQVEVRAVEPGWCSR